MDIYAIINKPRKQEILQNSISIAFPSSFFDQENYEHTSLINLFSFANLKQHPWSRDICQFSPLIIHPFPATFTPGEEILRSKKRITSIGTHNSRRLAPLWRRMLLEKRNPFASTLENREFTWATTFRIVNFCCVLWSVRFFSVREKGEKVVFCRLLRTTRMEERVNPVNLED